MFTDLGYSLELGVGIGSYFVKPDVVLGDTEPTNELVKIWHPWWLWEDYKAGFYETIAGDNKTKGEELYAEFLSSRKRFNIGLSRVIRDWRYSCEHNLTCNSMNRIAYLGQASLCIIHGIPACCRGGFKLLDKSDQQKADDLALRWLNIWADRNGYARQG